MAENENTMNAPVSAAPKDDEISILEVCGILWEKKFFLLFCLILGAVVGVLAAYWIRPQYTSDALLQIDVSGSASAKALGDMGALLESSSPADAEIELIKSRMVLNDVVEQEKLCYSATPIGKMNRLLHREGRMDLDSLYIPEFARTEEWKAVVLSPDSFAVLDPEEKQVLRGEVRKLLVAPYAGDTLAIRVSLLRAEAGEEFALAQSSPLNVARALATGLEIAEKGKKTGILTMNFSHRYPDRAAAILNAVANAYFRQNVEMRSAEAEKTLAFLEEQLPAVKAKLDTSEKVLADYRFQVGSVDMTGETHALLEKETNLQKQLLELGAERQRLVRLFTEEHPNVQTIVAQQQRIQNELNRLKKNAEKMPKTQQEILRLQADLSVNNTVYLDMLNKIQQFRVVRAGAIGNVRIVDYAQVETKPSKPKKTMIVLGSVAGGFVLGVLIIFFLRALSPRGVRSSVELERETGEVVLAKIPRTFSRVLTNRRRSGEGNPILVLEDPDDPASENIRSLLTAVEFGMLSKTNNVIMVTGIDKGIGKSFISLNFAAAMANAGKKVLLIDADMRRGKLIRKRRKGLVEVLLGKESLDSMVTLYDNVENLYVLSTGILNVTASELLRGQAFANLVAEAREKYDVVLIDTPPVALATDAELMATLATLVLFVLKYNTHSMEEIQEVLKRLKRYTSGQLALVMNSCMREHGYGYGYGYGYGGYGGGYSRYEKY